MTDPHTEQTSTGASAQSALTEEEAVSRLPESNEKDDYLVKPTESSDNDDVSVSEERVKARRRYGLLVFALLYTFFFSGAFFGWGPMQLLLEDNGSFASKCTVEEQQREEICPAQSAALVRVHFSATITQIVSPLLGGLVDRYGPTSFSYLMGSCGCFGVVFLILAAQAPEKEWVLFAAFFLLANSTWMGGLLTVRTGMVFQGRMRARVIFIMNSMFDAGSITYLGLRGLAQAFEWSLTGVVSLYLGMAIVLFGGTAYFWTIVEPERSETDSTEKVGNANRDEQRLTSEPEKNGERKNGETKDPLLEDTACVAAKKESDYVLIAERTQARQLSSGPFMTAAFYTTVMITANQWTLTTTRDFLGYLGDDEVGNKYLTIFTLLFPASLAALPFTDAITAKYGFHGGFHAINLLALGYSLIRILSDDLDVQIFGFILFSFFRSFLFGVTFSALPVFLSTNVVGKAMGLLYALPGLASFVNIPLSKFAIEEKGGDLFIPNLMYTCLIAPCMVASWMLARAIDKESMIKKQQSLP